jgi:hypothetical protein
VTDLRPAEDKAPETRRLSEHHDNPLERLELLAGDDDAIAAFLDEIDVHSPRERQMLTELARTRRLARPERFTSDHRHLVAALESLRRHGYHGSLAGTRLGPLHGIVRWGVELVARYIVVSYVRSVATSMRDLYRFREIAAEDESDELRQLRPARMDAEALVDITKTREIGVPAFLIGGLLIPLALSLYRLTTGAAAGSWQRATIVGAIGVLIGLVLSWFMLRGTAMASRRIRLSTREPLRAMWASVGNCGDPPKDQSRKFAVIGITLTVCAWIILPALVGSSLLN